MVAHSGLSLAAAGLAILAWLDGPVTLVYGLIALVGIGRAFGAPAVNTILPQLLPPVVFANLNAWVASSVQLAAIAGPAAGGLIIAATGSAAAAFSVASLAEATFVVLLLRVPKAPAARTRRAEGGVLAGLLLLACIAPALTHLHIQAYWEKAIQGAIILLAVIADGLRIGGTRESLNR